ncbi:LysM peptidoglycan-binding domain-containing protein [Rhabdothermincola salaria]|uniref:LysM peptidoglycan-binding domain-containing protein n=1 Tax=Rhabdothermincola salaria TaxID=2903142 RepID=UPI001E5AAEB7|nr:LysM domain-containing protein [Rhabdothermincola salaria]MCD9624877.1 LysM domain-containing protein [Rhabdothermincola salaria]
MTAVLTTSTPAPWHDLEPAPRGRVAPSRPQLRVLDGGRAAVRAQRRRTVRPEPLVLVAGLVLAALVALVLVGVASLLGAGAAAPGPAPTAIDGAGAVATAPAASVATEVVVRPGDTLWSIAASLRPDGDVRPVVDALAQRAGGADLVPGQRIDVRGLS